MDETRSKKSEVIAYAMQTNGLASDDSSRILMIGDRFHDIEGAKANNIKTCGVLYGYGTRAELEQAGADFIAPDVMSILSFV